MRLHGFTKALIVKSVKAINGNRGLRASLILAFKYTQLRPEIINKYPFS